MRRFRANIFCCIDSVGAVIILKDLRGLACRASDWKRGGRTEKSARQ
jgi:hypothetical protein